MRCIKPLGGSNTDEGSVWRKGFCILNRKSVFNIKQKHEKPSPAAIFPDRKEADREVAKQRGKRRR